MENEIVKLAMGQGLWAVLFVAMLFYVLKTSGEREKKLTDTLEILAKKFDVVEDIQKGVSRIEGILDHRGTQRGGGDT